jgi:hypothetical protein
MAQAAHGKEHETSRILIGGLPLLLVLFSLGPLGLGAACLTAAVLLFIGANMQIALCVALLAAASGMAVYHSLAGWVLEPFQLVWDLYALAFPDGLLALLLQSEAYAGDGPGLVGSHVLQWFVSPQMWLAFAPLGGFAGAAVYATGQFYRAGPLASLKRYKFERNRHKRVGTLQAAVGNGREADTEDGTIIGSDSAARAVTLSDQMANQHTLVLGTTGAGKTVTVCNIVESCINRQLPVIYIEGKGDYCIGGIFKLGDNSIW